MENNGWLWPPAGPPTPLAPRPKPVSCSYSRGQWTAHSWQSPLRVYCGLEGRLRDPPGDRFSLCHAFSSGELRPCRGREGLVSWHKGLSFPDDPCGRSMELGCEETGQ